MSTPTEFSCASCRSTNLAVNPTEGVYRCANCGFAGALPGAEAEVDPGTGALVGTDEPLTELGQAARRAGTIVTGYIDSIVADAERRADEIRQAGLRDRQAGERDAERARRDAFESASRVFERIQALERPLGELAHTLQIEMDRVGHELEGDAYEDRLAISAEADGASSAVEEIHDAEEVEEIHDAEEVPEAEEVEQTPQAEEVEETPEAEETPQAEEVEEPEQVPEAAQVQETRESEQVEESPAPEEAEAAPEPAMFAPGQEPTEAPQPKEKKDKGWFRRRRSGAKGAFITTEGHCAVCQKTFMAGSEEAFQASGWRANGDVGLCPDCQADRWQLPEGARLPFLRREPEEAPAAEQVAQAPEAEQVEEAPEAEEAPDTEEAEAAPEPAMFVPAQEPTEAPQPKEKKDRRRLRRRRSTAKGAFITTEGHCAVCQKTFKAGSEEAFEASGWRANGNVGLCPDCQADRWQLPEGARLPFRRGGA